MIHARPHLPSFVRSRSGFGLLIVVLLLVQLFVFGPVTCPIRPIEAPQFSAADTAAMIFSPASAAGVAEPAPTALPTAVSLAR